MKKRLFLILSVVTAVFITGCSTSDKYSGKPYTDSEYKTGIQTIPGRIYCAYYDLGGEGVAYHDDSKENHGSGELNPLNGTYLHSFRVDEGVDISYTKSNDVDNSSCNFVDPPMNMLYVGWTNPGEWTKYTVEVKETGNYRVGLMYTSNRGGKISISVDDKDATGHLDVPSTYRDDDSLAWRQWHHWNKINDIAEIKLKKGTRVLTLHTVEEGQMNYMWLDFTLNNVKDIDAKEIETVNPGPAFMLPPNTPKGEAKGIFPGRVAWVYAPNTANWDEQTGFWFEDRWNNQDRCDQMIRQSLFTLTEKKNEKEAWTTLFSYFNKNKGKKTLMYQPGEKIAIKINQNNTYSHEDSEELNASPQLTLSLLRSLIKGAGVPEEQITLFDASRFITNYLYNKCSSEFPHVKYVDNCGGDGRIQSTYVSDVISYSADNGELATGLVTCLEEADYVINMAILKGHVGQGVTLCAKNWYGAVNIHSDWRKNFHNNFNQDREGKAKYMTFVDFMGHKYTGEETLIYFIDGLYGSQNVAGKPSGKWKLSPFSGNWPNSLFASQDPVAIDAAGLDFLSSEWPETVDIDYADMYLLEAALANNPPSGSFYNPNKSGTGLKSLGVLEHWNNSNDKKYSRNLGKKEGIELVFKKN